MDTWGEIREVEKPKTAKQRKDGLKQANERLLAELNVTRVAAKAIFGDHTDLDGTLERAIEHLEEVGKHLA
jgi:hypothetical protein